MQRKRTVGNNYSGPRWAFSQGSAPREAASRGGGLTMMGGSNRDREVRRDEEVTYGPYSLVMSLLDGRMSIRRQDADHKRTVAFVDSMAEWDRFVAALKGGASEVAAVHAIDAGDAR